MPSAVALWLAGMLAVVAVAPPETLERLQDKYQKERWKARSHAVGDAGRALAMRDVSEEYRDKAWKLVRKRRRYDDFDAAWQFALSVDHDAGAEDLVENARRYLEEWPEGEARGYASYLVASVSIGGGADDGDVDEILASFDTDGSGEVLNRGKLRAAAAEAAIQRGDIARARTLLLAALALPKSAEELAQEERNGGESWHAWWQERHDALALFEQDWSEFGSADVKGVAWKVSDYRGKVLVLDYWASW